MAPRLRTNNRTRCCLALLRAQRIRQRQIEALGLNAVLRMLIAEQIGGAILSDNSAGKSGDYDRGAHKGSIGKFLVVSNRSHASNPRLTVVKHPIIHGRFCGHKARGGVAAASAIKLSQTTHRKHQISQTDSISASGRSQRFRVEPRDRRRVPRLAGLLAAGQASFFRSCESPSCTLRPVRYTSPAV